MTKSITKVTRFEIKGIDGEEPKLFRKILKDLQQDSRNQGNDVIKCLYENSRFKRIQIIEDFNIPEKSTQAKINDAMKRVYTKANTSGVETITQKVMSEWNVNQKKFGIGERTILSYRDSNSPLYVRNNQIKLIKNNNEYFIEVRLLSSSYAKQLENGMEIKYGKGKTIKYKKNRDGQWLTFRVIVKGDLNKTIFERVLNGDYKLGTSQFLFKENKRKWFFNLTYSFESEKKQLDPNRIMGIDVGVNIPAVFAISDDSYFSNRNKVGSKDEVEGFRRQIESRKRSVQRQRKWCGEGSIGHGVKTRIKPLDKLSGKIARFKDTKNHCWSRYIVNEAIKNDCGVIQMEDLTGISEDNTFLKTWTFYDLKMKIKYKAEEVGIKFVEVNPKHTSGRCHKCGHIHRSYNKHEWRPTQDKFKCQSCGFEANADWNAAKNISTKDIDKIIEKQLYKQEKEMKHNMEFVLN